MPRGVYEHKKLSEEHKKKISNSLKCRQLHKIDEETRKKISDKLKGKPLPEETKIKMSEAHKGKKLSESHKESLRRLWDSDEYKKLTQTSSDMKLKLSNPEMEVEVR